MGACCSSSSSPPFNSVRVIHISGYVEDYEAPVTVVQITGKTPKHVLCSASHLPSLGSLPNLRPDDTLEPGRLYFLLPCSVFHSGASPADIASLATRLTAVARRGPGTAISLSGRQNAEKSGPSVGLVSPPFPTWTPDLSPIVERSLERCEGFK